MQSFKACSSPTYKNIKSNRIHSPVELKEKLRKDYKSKVQNCRNMLLNRFRSSEIETDLRSTLTNIYNDIFNDTREELHILLSKSDLLDNEEEKIFEEIKQELIQDQLDRCLEEYEKAQMDNIDWSLLQQNENVICVICEKENFNLTNQILSCPFCNVRVKTNKSLHEINSTIFDSLDTHGKLCNNTGQFSAVCELNNNHIYFICESCMDMKLIV